MISSWDIPLFLVPKIEIKQFISICADGKPCWIPSASVPCCWWAHRSTTTWWSCGLCTSSCRMSPSASRSLSSAWLSNLLRGMIEGTQEYREALSAGHTRWVQFHCNLGESCLWKPMSVLCSVNGHDFYVFLLLSS